MERVTTVIRHGQLINLPCFERLRQNDSEIRILIFALLNEIQVLALLVLDAANSESTVKIERHHACSGNESAKGYDIAGCDMRALDRTLDFVMRYVNDSVIL